VSFGWITFLSDYGHDDAFVGVCHGVMARIAPAARVIDVCHEVAPQDVEQGATTLVSAVEYLPESIHLGIVDPGVGTSRRGVAVLTAQGSITVGPDNGVASLAWSALGGAVKAHCIDNDALWLANPAKTFHGRDIFAPVAAHLANGVALSDVGDEVDIDSLARITLRRSDLEAAGMNLGDTVELRLHGRTLQVPFTVTFGEVPPGRVAVCEDSYRRITVAVNLGHAAKTLRAGRGDPVVISRAPRVAPHAQEPIGILEPPPQPSTM
jgi:S-adenosylmethionine hydrolase